jgi:arginine/serine-rich splicing factor 4/5/6
MLLFRDADDAVHDLDGKDLRGGRVRVELAKDPRDRNRGRFGDRDDRDRGRRGNPPGPRTKYRIIVENVSSRTSWQVKYISFLYFSAALKQASC